MTAPGTESRLRAALRYALQEDDDDRELDSLERVVAYAYLTGQGLADDRQRPAPLPATIRAWLGWVCSEQQEAA